MVVLCGIIGAKILYIVNDWSYYSRPSRATYSVGRPCRLAEFSPEG